MSQNLDRVKGSSVIYPTTREMAGSHVLQSLAALSSRISIGRGPTLRIPSTDGLYQVMKGYPFHSTPELFYQIEGETMFRFPTQSFLLKPGELALIPRGMPHHETAFRGEGGFLNLVLMFPPNMISYHFGFCEKGTTPHGRHQNARNTPHATRMAEYLDDIARGQEGHIPLGEKGIDGLFLTVLSMWRKLAENATDEEARESILVSRCRHLVHQRLQDTGLSVQSLAAELNCAADYLSHTFSEANGERLTFYINSRRIDLAKRLLRETAMNISEVAYAVGYRDPGYFTRAFSRLSGLSPRQYRKNAGGSYIKSKKITDK